MYRYEIYGFFMSSQKKLVAASLIYNLDEMFFPHSKVDLKIQNGVILFNKKISLIEK